LLQYVDGRNTEDIDLIMAVPRLSSCPNYTSRLVTLILLEAGFSDLRVDVLLTSNPLFDEVRKRYTAMQRFVEQDILCATVEGLILLKLYALPSLYRQGNFTRVGLYEKRCGHITARA